MKIVWIKFHRHWFGTDWYHLNFLLPPFLIGMFFVTEPIAEFVEGSAEGRLEERGGSSCAPSFRRMSAFDGISRAGTSVSKRDQSAVKSKKVTAPKGKAEQIATNVVDRRRSLMPGPQRAGSFLTVQSLQEFDKSLQGSIINKDLDNYCQ